MQISPNKVVGITYTLTLQNGEIADTATAERPFVFIHGIGQTLEAFDKNLHGLDAGAAFKFSLTPDEGYGVSSPDMVISLSKSIFEGPDVPADLLELGNMVPMQDQEGNPLNGVIVEITDDQVKMDFNHPLADQDLHFEGTVISVRDASADELDHGHVHGDGGHQH
jgi:FKBP-type peptidyl-prolyl cis-trans isomerase SlyD